MAPRRRPLPVQPDLLDWAPTAPYPDAAIRASTMAGRISRAVAQTLKDSPLTRAEVAARMSAFLGEAVSIDMLNAYASLAREDHNISAVRFAALLHATDDRRLLELLAEPFSLAVVTREQLDFLELGRIAEEMEALKRARDQVRYRARRGS